MLQYGDQNNFTKYRKCVQSYAYQQFGYLGNIFIPGTTSYYYPSQPVRPSEAELLALPDDATRDTAIDIYREEVKLWVKEKGILVKNQLPLFDAIYMSLSETSQAKIKEAANWTEINKSKDPLLLWARVVVTHANGTDSTVRAIIQKKARDRYCKLTQGTNQTTAMDLLLSKVLSIKNNKHYN